jgi:hypothetical protein
MTIEIVTVISSLDSEKVTERERVSKRYEFS